LTETTPPSQPTSNADAKSRIAPREGSIKETLESIIIAFILAFVFRAFVVEAFVIPTGSMAPTLLGQHVSLQCEMCGHAFKSGPRAGDVGVNRRTGEREPLTFQGQRRSEDGEWFGNPLEIDCPMCQHEIVEPVQRIQPGDRILVLKYIYAFTEPRRWDVVVFRNPEQPAQNYIKRLIGLPNEWLRIVRGNIYTSTDQGKTWQVQAKPRRVQEVVWQPVYHSKYVPLDAEQRGWRSPWRPMTGRWQVNEFGRSFDFDGEGTGALGFDFDHDAISARDFYAYNDLSSERRGTTTYIEDLRVAVTVEAAAAGAGLAVRMDTEMLEVRGRVDGQGEPTLAIRPTGQTEWREVGERLGIAPIKAGRPIRLELWQVDHEITLIADGEALARHRVPLVNQPNEQQPFALTMERLVRMQRPDVPPQVRIETTGAPVRLSSVNLDRDLYYTESRVNALATGGDTAELGPDQFFCLGDNSPQSKDSRLWESIDPWIPHHLGDVPLGIVPRRLMIGRAFFVYFPAPLKLSATGMPIIPNFGDLRFID